MNWTHFGEAVFLGLAVGLMLWILKKHEGQSRLKLWVIATGTSLGIYLALKMLGVSSEGMGVRILLAIAIMMAANTLLQFLTLLLWEHLARKQMELPIPRLVIDVLTFIVMATLAVVLLNTLFSVKLTAFLVTSTVLSAVIGLSLQDILGNVFAGLSLQLERPYEMEDWVEVDGIQGAIEEMNWRVLTIRTRDNDLMTVPNATVSKTVVTNYSKPTRLHLTHIKVGVGYAHPPERVKKVLMGAVSDTNGISTKPSPAIFLSDFGNSSIEYDVRFWIKDFSRKLHISDAVRSRIWYCLQRAGMSIPFPIRDVYLHTVAQDHEDKLRAELHADIIKELQKVEIFKPLAGSDITTLADHSSILRYTRGETMVRQNDSGDSLYIIRSGSVEITLKTGKSEPVVLASLGPGKCFGEMSLLTGEPRSATVTALEETQVVVVDKDGLKALFESNPALVEPLSTMLEKRSEEQKASRMKSSRRRSRTQDKSSEKNKEDLMARVKSFFKL
ncbi:MAG: mechanosensitive ion channel family protein [Candidatus Fermentibacteria bacterium]|nr:mechanosensitive ion channel family protein [Candidatus Fermentibacteria bacterium]